VSREQPDSRMRLLEGVDLVALDADNFMCRFQEPQFARTRSTPAIATPSRNGRMVTPTAVVAVRIGLVLEGGRSQP